MLQEDDKVRFGPVTCPGGCTGEVEGGIELLLVNEHHAGSVARFTFDGDCEGSTCRVPVVDRDLAITATVSPGKLIVVEHVGDGQGTVASTPGGIACPGTCEAVFAPEQVVGLEAFETDPSVFRGWFGASGCATGAICDLPGDPVELGVEGLVIELDASFDANRLVVTPFGANITGDLIHVFGGGESEARIVCETTCELSFNPDVPTAVRLEAVVTNPLHKFSEWLGFPCLDPIVSPCEFDIPVKTDLVGVGVFELALPVENSTSTCASPDRCDPDF